MMTKEQQCIAVAEWMGWKYLSSSNLYGTDPVSKYILQLPNYPEDLNAIHEAEKKIRENQFHYVSYPENLFLVVTGRKWDGNMGYFMFCLINATAPQRLEALCRTLWPERFEE